MYNFTRFQNIIQYYQNVIYYVHIMTYVIYLSVCVINYTKTFQKL